MKSMLKQVGVLAVAGMLLGGCTTEKATETAAPAAASPELAKLVMPEGAPADAVGVHAAREQATDGQEVKVEGRIKDFVEGHAVFTMMDHKVPSCNEIPGDKCETPWDYCCEPKESVQANSATVQLVGSGDEPLAGTLKGVSTLDHLTTVVATGKAQRDDAGNLIILADHLYLKK